MKALPSISGTLTAVYNLWGLPHLQEGARPVCRIQDMWSGQPKVTGRVSKAVADAMFHIVPLAHCSNGDR